MRWLELQGLHGDHEAVVFEDGNHRLRMKKQKPEGL
jgi:hypothetical protein